MKRLLVFCVAACALGQTPALEKTIPLEEVKKGIGGMAVDAGGHRLFVSASGNDSVSVIDLASGQVTRTLTGLRQPQGLLFWPAKNRLYIAGGMDGHVTVLDGTSFERLADYDFNSNAAEFGVDPAHDEVFVGFGDGAVGVINADLKRAVDKIVLPMHPQGMAVEKTGHRVFVNVPGNGAGSKDAQVFAIDRRTRSVVARWQIDGERDNAGMALDEAHKRLFVGCGKPPALVVLDTESGNVVAQVALRHPADGVAFDASGKQIFVAGEKGALNVVQQSDPDHYTAKDEIAAGDGPVKLLVSEELKRLFVALPRQGHQRSEVRVFSLTP